MNAFRRATLLTASAILALGIWGCGRETAQDTATGDDNTAHHDADNTARNANPQYQANTPFEQGTSQTDRDLTQKIRQAVMDDTALSTTAHNVKIITRDGQVLLQGPVMSAQERTRIAAIATEAAGVGNVKVEIEVKTQS